MDNYYDELFSEGIPRVFESLIQQRVLKERQNVAIQHYDELMVLFVNSLRWATAAVEDPPAGRVTRGGSFSRCWYMF